MNSLTSTRHPSSQRFVDLLDEAVSVHDRKQHDYGRADDPFANVRASEDFGIPGWVGCAVRMNDKMRRIQAAAQRLLNGVAEGDLLANESLEDAFMDLLVYAGIGVVMLREAHDAATSPAKADTSSFWRGDEHFDLIAAADKVPGLPGVKFHTGI